MDREHAPPLRSVLFVAGDQPADLERAWSSGADSIVIDLEEPRTPFPEPARETARRGVRAFLDGIDADATRPLRFVRVQPPATG